jgi:methylmalonyl-CoA/ethylmalonyl-CoA epimerase
MSDSIKPVLDLPPIDQVGWVVADMDRALGKFEALFGPFRVGEAKLEGALYRGRPADVTLKLATARSGGIEIELIQVIEGESPHREFVERHGDGPHHVRFRVTGIDEKIAVFAESGYETIWYKRINPDIAFAYVEAPLEQGGGVVELYEGP